VYFWLPNITNPMYIQYVGEIVPPTFHKTVGVCNIITFIILYYNSSGLVPLLEINNALHMSMVLLILHNFSFQICLAFFPETSAIITSYIVHIIYNALAWILYSLHFSLLHLI
jgi:hypothetical protein